MTTKPPILLVDTSYWLYYRFFALRKWYNRAFPEKCAEQNFNLQHNWLEDEIFINKYKKIFINNIKILCRKFKIKIENVIFCIDCSHNNIWRIQHYTDYKATRQESHKKKEFNSWDLFKYIKNIYLPELAIKYGFKILSSSNCEADDLIGFLAPFLINKNYNTIYILASDNDYQQICNNNIIMINGKGGILNIDTDPHKYLLRKILIGDNGDNIKPCNIDIGFLEKGIPNGKYKIITKTLCDNLFNDIHKYNIIKSLLDNLHQNTITDNNTINNTINTINNNIITNFNENAKLIDFFMIPKDIKEKLTEQFNSIF